MSEYRIELYRPELRSRLLALQSHHWGAHADANDRYFTWKYEQNPYLGEILVYLATLDGEVVGMRGAFGARWIDSAGASVGALCAGDLVVRPQDRNRFVPRRIMEAMAEDLRARGFRYLLNLSASRFTYLISLRQGFRLAVEHGVASRQTKLRLLLRAGVRLRAAIGVPPGPGSLAAFDRAAAPRSRRRPSAVSVELACRAAEMADLCARAERSADSIRQQHDQRFLEWRYRNPFARYRFLYWRESSRLDAYLVVQQHPADDRYLALVDWAFVSAEAMTQLVETSLELAGWWPVVVWLGSRPDAEHALFLGAGLLKHTIPEAERRRPGLLVQDLAPESSAPDGAAHELRRESWTYNMIDGDGY